MESEIADSIGERIRKFAKAEYKTASNLAITLGMAPNQLHAYISGRIEPSAKILAKFAALNCNLNWLVTGIGSMLNAPQVNNEIDKSTPFEGQGDWVKKYNDACQEILKLNAKVEILQDTLIKSNTENSPSNSFKKGVPAWSKLPTPVSTK